MGALLEYVGCKKGGESLLMCQCVSAVVPIVP